MPVVKKIIIGILVTLATSGTLFFQSGPDGLLHVYFLNVGQGDATLIKSPAGKTIIIDGGPGKTVLTELNATLPFFNKGIDYAILTHPDRDHIEGFLYILKKYRVKNVIFTAVGRRDYFYDTFLKRIREQNIAVTVADEKSDISLSDGLFIDVLYPFQQLFGEKTLSNSASVAVKIIYGKNSVFIAGDADFNEENELMRKGGNLRATILKVNHHGSATSTSEDFLKAVQPIYSVISVGAGNTYGHPHKSLLKRLQNARSQIFRTDRDGRVEFVMDRNKVVEIKMDSGFGK